MDSVHVYGAVYSVAWGDVACRVVGCIFLVDGLRMRHGVVGAECHVDIMCKVVDGVCEIGSLIEQF